MSRTGSRWRHWRRPRRSVPPSGSSPAQRSGSATARDKTAPPRGSSPTRSTQTTAPPPRQLPVRQERSAASRAVPLHQRLETDQCPSQPLANSEWRIGNASGSIRYSPLAIRLSDHVRQQPEEPRPLDGAGKLALLLRRDRSDAARHDFAALGDVALQQPHVLVVDFRRIGAGERAGLAAAEERSAGLLRGKCHGPYSSAAALSSAPSRGGRPSRSRSRS